ncbi:hypothetical protein ncot_01160 [Nocardioides sp. JQ2195]|uniref:hypothetical protein n=1 Tax=Nocardioides sp. JQ2195 TaxID=2592334 RepID=UPI00143E99F8|nr:hypothetical protein [Nocardioides sp. JQ2195]QIX25348.1 hypothetical protein ncot_01160 [Nocardioides sp. JQ2195]
MSIANFDSGELARQVIEERIARAAVDRRANSTVRVPRPGRRQALARQVRRIADVIDN